MKKEVDLSQYVSNLDRNVYTIFNLPEEVIAVIFAYVSRSSASFRDNLRKLLEDEELAVDQYHTSFATAFSEKAAKFHEKWVIGYGHSSVAEHAVAHIGIEKISRLASAELELANSFNSFTEYSQRYQRPKRGDYYIPPELEENPQLKREYLSLQEKAFDCYEQLMEKLYPYLLQTLPKEDRESDRRFQLRAEKIAFEDARYVLTLATYTNLGMTGNGRALRDTIVRLLSSPYTEAQRLAKEMEREISKAIPTLLKYVRPNEYLLSTRKQLEQNPLPVVSDFRKTNGPVARFTQMPDYDQALTQLTSHLLVRYQNLPWEVANHRAMGMNRQEKEKWAEQALKHLRFFDHPIDETMHLFYHMEMKISEANWHQLLRHNRRTYFSYGSPTIDLGITIPPNIEKAGLRPVMEDFLETAETVYRKVADWNPQIASYCVTNAHLRQITASANLWELYHLINLRTSPEAQWDIRLTFEQLLAQLKEKHPIFAKYAQRRNEP